MEMTMRMIFALAVVAATAISVPAFAQSVGAPGAVGTGGGLSGSNTPGSGVSPQGYYDRQSYDRAPGYYGGDFSAERSQPTWSVYYNRVGSNPTWSNPSW
jgi:hypothetical protein